MSCILYPYWDLAGLSGSSDSNVYPPWLLLLRSSFLFSSDYLVTKLFTNMILLPCKIPLPTPGDQQSTSKSTIPKILSVNTGMGGGGGTWQSAKKEKCRRNTTTNNCMLHSRNDWKVTTGGLHDSYIVYWTLFAIISIVLTNQRGPHENRNNTVEILRSTWSRIILCVSKVTTNINIFKSFRLLDRKNPKWLPVKRYLSWCTSISQSEKCFDLKIYFILLTFISSLNVSPFCFCDEDSPSLPPDIFIYSSLHKQAKSNMAAGERQLLPREECYHCNTI